MSQNDSALAGNDGSIDPNDITNYKELFHAFLAGVRTGSHRKMEIVERNGRTLLVAYEKWVYATRENSSGIVTVYTKFRDNEDATNASNIQAGYLRQALEERPAFEQSLLHVEQDGVMPDIEGDEYERFNVEVALA